MLGCFGRFRLMVSVVCAGLFECLLWSGLFVCAFDFRCVRVFGCLGVCLFASVCCSIVFCVLPLVCSFACLFLCSCPGASVRVCAYFSLCAILCLLGWLLVCLSGWVIASVPARFILCLPLRLFF